MERKIRRCVVCGSEYKFCPRCNEDADKPLWYFTFCAEQCKNIYNITSGYEDGKITANVAKTKLDELDLSKLDKFGTSYKASIEKINSTAAKEVIVEETVETIIETKDGENVENIEETAITEAVEEKVIKKSKRAKRNVYVE